MTLVVRMVAASPVKYHGACFYGIPFVDSVRATSVPSVKFLCICRRSYCCSSCVNTGLKQLSLCFSSGVCYHLDINALGMSKRFYLQPYFWKLTILSLFRPITIPSKALFYKQETRFKEKNFKKLWNFCLFFVFIEVIRNTKGSRNQHTHCFCFYGLGLPWYSVRCCCLLRSLQRMW